jgi:hypothetical protein
MDKEYHPLPWSMERRDECWTGLILDARGDEVCLVNRDYARGLIVQAVNAHDGLLSELGKCAHTLESCALAKSPLSDAERDYLHKIVQRARELIARADGQLVGV